MKDAIIQNRVFFHEVATRIADGERVCIRAKGNSMLPFIRDGKDKVILETTNATSFQEGRLLLVKLSGERYVLHRVKKISGNLILLHGDGNLSVFESSTKDEVIAEATEIIRNGKLIRVGSMRWNLFRHLWPGNLFLRRACLALYSKKYCFYNCFKSGST